MMRPASAGLIKVATNDLLLQQRSKELQEILENQKLLDVTFLTETEEISAHKLILSTASPVLRNIFERSSERHPLVFMKGSKLSHIRTLLDFIYKGEALVDGNDLSDFICLVNDLKIEGLAESLETYFEDESKMMCIDQNKHKQYDEMVEVQEPFKEKGDSNDADDVSIPQKDKTENYLKPNTVHNKKRKYNRRSKSNKSIGNHVIENFAKSKLTPKKNGGHQKIINSETYNIDFDEDMLELETSSSEIMSDFGLTDYGDDEMNMEEKKSWETQARAYLRSTPKYKQLRERLLTMVIKHSSHNYGCTECDIRMISQSKALEHVGQHENKLDNEHKFVCDCGKSYSKMTSIRFHYPCPEALKKFIKSVQSVATKYSASSSDIAEALSSTTNMDEDLS